MRRIVNISMPNSLYTFVDERSRLCGYGSISEYVRSLIRADQRRVEEQRDERMERELRYREICTPTYR